STTPARSRQSPLVLGQPRERVNDMRSALVRSSGSSPCGARADREAHINRACEERGLLVLVAVVALLGGCFVVERRLVMVAPRLASKRREQRRLSVLGHQRIL